jgi:uncharacterized protein YijF (DUF1287 family)
VLAVFTEDSLLAAVIAMVLESTVSIAKIGTNSLRSTVPEGIVSYLDVQAGDKLEWRMENLNNERVAVVSKKLKKGEIL